MKKNAQAVWHGLKFTTVRHPFTMIVVVFTVVMLVIGVVRARNEPIVVPTPEQIAAREANLRLYAQRQAQQVAIDQSRMVRRKDLCRIQTACTKYATIRQECATAGNYNTCLGIKMGVEVYLADQCTADGKIASSPADEPYKAECYLLEKGLSF